VSALFRLRAVGQKKADLIGAFAAGRRISARCGARRRVMVGIWAIHAIESSHVEFFTLSGALAH
jgi:hypothetical protein